MDAQKELEKWKADFSVAKTPEEQAAHKKRFNAFLQSLSAEDKKAFAAAFQAGAKLSVTESQNLIKIVEIRQARSGSGFCFYVIYCKKLFRENSPMVLSACQW